MPIAGPSPIRSNPAYKPAYSINDLNVGMQQVKLSQSVVEVVEKGTTFARLSQSVVETIIKGTTYARLSQSVVEVVISNLSWAESATIPSVTTLTSPTEGLSYQELGPNDFDVSYLNGNALKSVQSNSTLYKLAQGFVPTVDAVIYGGSIYVTKIGAPTDSLVVELQTDSSGSPSGTAIATTTLGLSSLVAGVETEVPFVFALGASVTGGSTYYFVSYRNGSTDAVNYWKISTDSSASALGQLKEFS